VHGTIESVFRVEWRPFAELAAIADDWRALAARALEPNVFYEPAFALAAQPVFGENAGAGLVWSRATPLRLLGLFPATITRRRYGVPLPVLVGWTHPYAPLGMPLVDRDAAEPVIGAWLDHLASRRSPLPGVMLLPMFPRMGALAQALDSVLTRHRGRSVAFAAHERALLAPGAERAAYIERVLPHKKLKELRRQLRRLGDDGVVMTGITNDPAAIPSALGDFLALEAGGWKGRAGTAARGHADVRTFMERAVGQLAAEGKAQVARLFLDTRAIAAIIALRSGDTAWCWKIAYDESYSRASPGVQLLLHVTNALLDDARIARADSCATPDHPMIDHVWRERLPLADRLVRVGPRGRGAFALARTLETALRAAIGAAKGARDLIRR
jgi:CelD/BcsL family acetyltransferase involved in cellulose biosynthesis